MRSDGEFICVIRSSVIISRAVFLEERFPARRAVLRAKWLAILPKPPDRSCEETSVAMNAANPNKKQER